MIIQNVRNIIKNIPPYNTFGEKIELVAATKKQSIQNIQQALLAGIYSIAENTVQEFLQKEAFFHTLSFQNSIQNTNETIPLQRHFIGKLQRNKVKYLVHKIDLLHSLDSLTLAEEIERQGEKHNWICPCLLQVNIAKEDTKSGFFVEELERAYLYCTKLNAIKLCGLMAILPKHANTAQLLEYARQMRLLFDQFKADSVEFCHLSMGMSNDYKICIEAGSNMLRLGTAIFGSR